MIEGFEGLTDEIRSLRSELLRTGKSCLIEQKALRGENALDGQDVPLVSMTLS